MEPIGQSIQIFKTSNENYSMDHKNSENLCHICSLKISPIDLESHFLDCISKGIAKSEYVTNDPDIKEQCHQCDNCVKTFRNIAQLKRHITISHNVKTLKCNVCEKPFSTAKHLKTHTGRVHAEHTSYNCDICGKTFRSQGDLKAHVNNVHQRTKELLCQRCNKSFASSKDKIEHYQSDPKHKEALAQTQKNRVKKINKEIVCYICFTSLRESSLKNHIQTVHIKNEKTFICQICEKSFLFQRELVMHFTRVHVVDKKIKCDFCPRTFFQISNLEIHLLQCQMDYQQEKCEFCDSILKSKKQLAQHINNIHKGEKTKES